MAITSAIVPYQANKSSAMVQPQQSMSAIVPMQKETAKKAEVTARDVRASVLRLLRKRQQRDRLEAKYYNLEKTLNERQKARKEEKKNESKSLLGSVGSGFRARARKAGGDLLGSIGKLLGFLALDWLSKPENQAIVKGIVSGVGAVFKFVDFWVTGSVDNLLSGFSQFVGGDTILERVLGFFQMAAGFFGLKYFLKPNLIIDDLTKVINFFREGGVRKIKIFLEKTKKYGLKKGLKFAFPRLAKVLEKFTGIGGRILKGIKEKLGLNKAGNLFAKIGNALLRKMPVLKVAKRAIFKLLRPVTGFLKSIPFVGGLISFGVNMLLGDPPGEAGIKAIGGSLGSWIGAGIGSIVFPGVGTFLGGLLGGLLGDFIGSRFYDLLKGKKAKQPTPDEEERMALLRRKAELKKRYRNRTEGAILKMLADEKGITVEQLKEKLADKVDRQGGTDGTAGTIPPAGSNAKALLNTIRFAEGTSGPQGYNTWFGGSQYAGDLSQYTINEIVELQKKFLAEGHGRFDGGRKKSAAVGAYQMIKPEAFAAKAGLDPATAKFTPENQDLMAIAGYMKGQAGMTQAEIDAPISREQIAKMAPVWASLPNLEGKSEHNQPVKSFETLQKVYNKSLAGGQGGGPTSIPMQKQSNNRLSETSMDVVQSKRRRPRKKVTVIVNNQGDTLISAQKVSMLGTLNSTNKPQLVKRGI